MNDANHLCGTGLVSPRVGPGNLELAHREEGAECDPFRRRDVGTAALPIDHTECVINDGSVGTEILG